MKACFARMEILVDAFWPCFVWVAAVLGQLTGANGLPSFGPGLQSDFCSICSYIYRFIADISNPKPVRGGLCHLLLFGIFRRCGNLKGSYPFWRVPPIGEPT